MFLAVGISLAVVPFIKSMNPSAKAGMQLPHFDVSTLTPGEYVLSRNLGEVKYLILKDYDSNIYVYWLPVKDNQVLMPDVHWWHWGGLCSSFGPDASNGKLLANGVIRCRDDIRPDWLSKEWRWTYDGKSLGKYTDDMERVKFTIEGRYLIAGKGNKNKSS